MLLTQYDAKDCTITVDGVYITGLGEDMISFEKEEAYFETSVGAQGDIVQSMINNSIYNLSITIQSTSPQKAFLMSKFGSRETFPVWVTNKKLGERFGGTLASVKEMPSISRAAEVEDMEIPFVIFDGVIEAAV